MIDGGEVVFYSVSNIAEAGKKPKKGYTKLNRYGYEERVVGVSRYSIAKQFDAQIEKLIRVPSAYELDTDCVAVLFPYSHHERFVYKIYQIQQVSNDFGLPVTDVSLTKLEGLDATEIENNCGCACHS